jgi:hypothetical protein
VVLLRGAAAQHVRDPAPTVLAASAHREQAEALAATISDQPMSVPEADWRRAVSTLQTPENWQRVERLAARLAQAQLLDGDEVYRLIGSARGA